MNEPTPIPPFPFARAAMVLGAVALGGVIGAWVLLAPFGVGDQTPVLIGSALACLAGSLIALLPVRQASKISFDRVPMAVLSGMGIRLAVAVAGGLVMTLGLGLPGNPVALWLIGCYLVLLIVDVIILIRYVRAASAVMASSGGAGLSRINHHAEAPTC